MKKYLWVLLAMFWLPVVVKADGMVIYPPQKPVYETGQKAVIWYDGKKETMIVSTTFRGSAEDFAWVIPVPSKPEVSQGKDELFTALDDYTRPKYQERVPVPMMGLGGVNYDMAGTAQTVTVLETKRIDIYDVTVLAATDGTALREWLTSNGYEYPLNRDFLLQYYVDKNWYFVAAKVTTAALGYVGSELTEGHATPLSISFNWPTIIYPLKISGPGSTIVPTPTPTINEENGKVAAFGFEQGTEGWYGGKATNEDAWQGKNSYRVDVLTSVAVSNGMSFSAGKSITGIQNGNNYVLSAYVKTKGTMSGNIKLRVFDGYGYEDTNGGDLNKVKDWKRLTVPFTANGQNIDLYLNADVTSGNGEVYWDGVQIEEGSQPRAFTGEMIPGNVMGGPGGPVLYDTVYKPIMNTNMTMQLYVFADHKKTVPGFTTDYAGSVPAKDIEKMAVNDDGTPWIKPAKKMYLTKLSRNMTQAQMTDDIIVRDAGDNTAVGGVGDMGSTSWRPLLVLGIPVTAEILFFVYYWYSKKKKGKV